MPRSIRADRHITVSEIHAEINVGVSVVETISADELIEVRFVFRGNGCAWVSGTRFVTHISVTTLKLMNLSPNYADINCIGSLNVP